MNKLNFSAPDKRGCSSAAHEQTDTCASPASAISKIAEWSTITAQRQQSLMGILTTLRPKGSRVEAETFGKNFTPCSRRK